MTTIWIILAVIIVIGLIQDAMAEPAKRRARDEESKRPPQYCALCHKPDKKTGDSFRDYFQTVGKRNLSVCDGCRRSYSFCWLCDKPIKDPCYSEIGKPLCLACFEKIPRKWRFTQLAALEHYGRQCAICKRSSKLHVHHKTYKNEGSERMDDLIVLCAKCHDLQHREVHVGKKGAKFVIKNGKKKYVKDNDVRYQHAVGDCMGSNQNVLDDEDEGDNEDDLSRNITYPDIHFNVQGR